ncbi:MAG: hypothetical protein KBD23_02670 [Gammaproteobacteria bacterium]|nr:hypothetical protein [Gammaproteobacteria bacterium]MBP9729028.1 hypothetical protein [Gammaproteobacteria bacterium]
MTEQKKSRPYLMAWVSGVGLMAVFYAWVAGAAASKPSVSTWGRAATTQPFRPPAPAPAPASAASPAPAAPAAAPVALKQHSVDPAVQKMLDQRDATIQDQQNTAIQEDMYHPTTLSPADTLLTQHLSGYCASGMETGLCSSDPSLMFGDIKVSSILSGSSYDDASKAAAQAFLQTLLTPLDNSAVSSFQSYGEINADMLSKNPTLKQQYVQALSDEALLSVVREAFAGMMAKRTPPTADSGAEAMPSEMALMEKDVLQRWMNNSWKTDLAGLSPEQIQQEIALMQASQLYMEYQRYQQMERVEALLAVSVLQNYRNQKNANALIAKTTTAPDSSTYSEGVDDSGQ